MTKDEVINILVDKIKMLDDARLNNLYMEIGHWKYSVNNNSIRHIESDELVDYLDEEYVVDDDNAWEFHEW